MFFSCLRLHSDYPRDRKGDRNDRFEGSQRWTIQDVQQCFLYFHLAEPEVLIIGKAADPTLRTSRNSTRRFLRKDVEGKDIIVVLMMLRERPRKQQVFVPRNLATKKTIALKPENEENDVEEY